MQCKLVELTDREDIKLVRKLLEKYHTQQIPRGGGLARGSRWFAWECDGYIVAAAWLHLPSSFVPIFQKFNLPQGNSYFIRRVCKFAPGDYLVNLLNAITEKLKAEGKEIIVSMGLDDHSNALYKNAGFEQIGIAPKSSKPVFVKRLK